MGENEELHSNIRMHVLLNPFFCLNKLHLWVQLSAHLMEQIISREWFTPYSIFYRVLRECLPCVSIHLNKMFLRSRIEWCTKSVCPKLGWSLCSVRKNATFATLIIRLECLKVTSLKTPSATESVFNDFSLLGWRLCTVLSFPRRISLPLRGAVTVKPSVESGAL